MKLVILDGNSIANRAFYGIRNLNAPDGTPTNAIYGFLTIMARLLEDYAPEAICVAFDTHAPTFRHKANADYKATRKGMPEELAVQMPILKDVLDHMGVRHYEKEGYEADDLLGTAGKICTEKGWECIVVTGDKDSLQLVTDCVSVCNVKTRMGQTEYILYTPEVFREEYGFDPPRMVDLKSLMGDSSDNIPGVPGIGEKTAKELLKTYGSLDAIYEENTLSGLKDSVKKKLEAGKESAYTSFWLATILCEVPFDFSPEENVWNKNYDSGLYACLKNLGFQKFIEKWGVEKTELPAKATAEEENLPKYEKLSVVRVTDDSTQETLYRAVKEAEQISVWTSEDLNEIQICDGTNVYAASWVESGFWYEDILRNVFSPEVKKAGHNIKDLMTRLLKEGMHPEGFVFDTALSAYMLDATAKSYDINMLSMKYLQQDLEGAEAIYRLMPVMREEMKKLSMLELYENCELPLCEVLSSMEDAGFLVDKKALEEFGKVLDRDIEVLQQSIYSYAGHEFNINSPKQLGTVLFEELMLPSGKKTKTGWSTNADVLEKLRSKHEIVNEILEYRTLSKLKSTYCDGLSKVIAPDGRIHSTFQMTVTATGRLSSTEPNLQNIPVRKAIGAEIRKMFIAGEGCTLVDADYSQIELRLLACIANDTAMQEAFLSGEDFHTVTASKVFNVPVEDVTKQMRSSSKAVNFGIIYGISAYSLSQDIGVTTSEAKVFIERYLERYPGVRAYMTDVIKKAEEKGYAETVFGRRRYLPELKDKNHITRAFGERIALNMPVQGTAADVIKMAMVRVFERLKKEQLKARLILQVHDELIVECPLEEEEIVRKLVEEEMEHTVSFAVPLNADAKSGKSWYEAH